MGLVEQNCYSDCRTGVLKDLSVRDAPPDVDCVKSAWTVIYPRAVSHHSLYDGWLVPTTD